MISSSDCHLSVGYRDKLSETRVPSRVQRKGPYLRMRNMLNTAQIELHVKARGNPTYRSAYKKRTLEPLDSTWLQHAPSLHTITWCNSGIGSKHNAGNTPASLVIYNYRLWIPSKRTSIVPMGNWYTAEWPLREIIGKNCPLLYLYCKWLHAALSIARCGWRQHHFSCKRFLQCRGNIFHHWPGWENTGWLRFMERSDVSSRFSIWFQWRVHNQTASRPSAILVTARRLIPHRTPSKSVDELRHLIILAY